MSLEGNVARADPQTPQTSAGAVISRRLISPVMSQANRNLKCVCGGWGKRFAWISVMLT